MRCRHGIIIKECNNFTLRHSYAAITRPSQPALVRILYHNHAQKVLLHPLQ
jgi:hypothetical protein